jgi:hypothetical protein
MTRFADQLFDDLMREHGSALEHARPLAQPGRHVTARRTALAGCGTLAVAGAVAGVLVAGSGTPAERLPGSGVPTAGAAPSTAQPYAVTRNGDGSITLAVYRKSGIAGANARLHQLGENQVVVVPVEAGCPAVAPPAVPTQGVDITTGIERSSDGSITVSARGIPAGDILVVGVETSGDGTSSIGAVTSPPAPSCIGTPSAPPGGGGSGS